MLGCFGGRAILLALQSEALRLVDALVDERPIELPKYRLNLLRGFELVRGDRAVPMFMNTQRLIAFLALQQHAVPRAYIAGVLWPEVPDGRAAGNLRSELWRLRRRCLDIVETRPEGVRISPAIFVDVLRTEVVSRSVIDSAGNVDDCARDWLLCARGDLLPGWYDDWVLTERERHHQLRFQALEVLCQRLTEEGRYRQAVLAGA